ncbi:MAG TPA: primosomal protein, partial [Pseudonocardiaceae bacterium]|nr:primosomal protein [Pseudonocardiaceae bacterium]
AQRYDLIGVPELVADPPDTWVIGELADVVAMVRSLAEVCGLDVVHEVLSGAPGFDLLEGGTLAFSGREGGRRWDELCTVIAQRWDEVIDAVDGMIRTPDVDRAAVTAAQAELSRGQAAEDAAPAGSGPAGPGTRESDAAESDAAEQDHPEATLDVARVDDPVLAFWAEVGIDPIRIISDVGDHYTLRCYVDDSPVFLGSDQRIDVFSSPRTLARYLAGSHEGNDLEEVSTWPQVKERANAGELKIAVDEGNCYVLSSLADDLAGGPQTVDPVQLDLAVELITDAEQWAGSDAADEALASSEPLGWLVSFVLRPDPTRLAPSPPFDAEVQAWRTLVSRLEDRLRPH